MKKKIKVTICNGIDIVAEACEDGDYREICVGVEKNGVWVQDIAIVGRAYDVIAADCFENDRVYVAVFADETSEDYTHKFVIPMYKEDEDESV